MSASCCAGIVDAQREKLATIKFQAVSQATVNLGCNVMIQRGQQSLELNNLLVDAI
jgi:hypothetical protein